MILQVQPGLYWSQVIRAWNHQLKSAGKKLAWLRDKLDVLEKTQTNKKVDGNWHNGPHLARNLLF